jgi:hypothetical protein
MAELRLGQNIPVYPPVHMLRLIHNKKWRDAVWLRKKMPFFLQRIPFHDRDLHPLPTTWVQVFNEAVTNIPVRNPSSIVGDNQFLMNFTKLTYLLKYGVIAKPMRTSSAKGILHLKAVGADKNRPLRELADVETVEVYDLFGEQIIASPNQFLSYAREYSFEPFILGAKKNEYRFVCEIERRDRAKPHFLIKTEMDEEGHLSYEQATLDFKEIPDHFKVINSCIYELDAEDNYHTERLKHVLLRFDFFKLESYDEMTLTSWREENEGVERNEWSPKPQPDGVEMILNEVEIPFDAYLFLNDVHSDKTMIEDVAKVLGRFITNYRGGAYPP